VRLPLVALEYGCTAGSTIMVTAPYENCCSQGGPASPCRYGRVVVRQCGARRRGDHDGQIFYILREKLQKEKENPICHIILHGESSTKPAFYCCCWRSAFRVTESVAKITGRSRCASRATECSVLALQNCTAAPLEI